MHCCRTAPGTGSSAAGSRSHGVRLHGQEPVKEALVATQTVRLSREQLAAIPDSYFKAVDAKDVDAILSHFAADAVLIVQTDHAVFGGADEIRRMFIDFCDHSVSIFHEIKNIVVEPDTGKIATEQSYIGELNDGTKNDMHNCNFFDVDAEGKFTRVIIWMAGTNPLK
jgi:ketosteroid isomerase-like protein